MRRKSRYRAFMRFICAWTAAAVALGWTTGIGPSGAHAAGTERKTLQASRSAAAPVIDGSLDEPMWQVNEAIAVPFGDGQHQNAAFGMLWDANYLYIAVKAEDDRLVHNGAGYWFEQDNMSLYFDPSLHRSVPFADSDMQIGIVYAPDSSTPGFYFGGAPNHAGKDATRILRAIRTTGDGWTAELAVPWDMLSFDPMKQKKLGFEISVTDRDDPAGPSPFQAWSAYQSESFWNDTSGYGEITLSDTIADGAVNDVLIDENFDGYEAGAVIPNWISGGTGGSPPPTVTRDTYGNGRLTFDGGQAGTEAWTLAPAQWDNYIVEADIRFEEPPGDAGRAGLLFRAAPEGAPPYHEAAIRSDGQFEVAQRKPDNSRNVMDAGQAPPLEPNQAYTYKLRVFDRNVKTYIKAKEDGEFTLLSDRSFDSGLQERGKAGLQASQSAVSFDNFKVTRIFAASLNMDVPETVEALTGPIAPVFSAQFSDGIVEPVAAERVRLYSSDESVIRIIDNRLYPLKEGQATVTAVYDRAETVRTLTVSPSATGAKVVGLKHDRGYLLAVAGQPVDLASLSFEAEYNDMTTGTIAGSELDWASEDDGIEIGHGTLTANRKGIFAVAAAKDGVSLPLTIVAKDAGETVYVLYEETFDSVPDGAMPQGWTRIEGTTAAKAAVQAGAFVLDARSAPDNPSRVLLPDYLRQFGDYTIEADVTHIAANDPTRWHSIMYRVQPGNYPYYQMAVRQDATAPNGVEFAERTPANVWSVIEKGPYAEQIMPDKLYRYTVKVRGNRVQQWIGDQLIVDTDQAYAYGKGGIGLQANGSAMKVDNIRVTLQEEPLPPLPADRFVQVTEPQSAIALAPTIAAYPDSWERLTAWAGEPQGRPATVFLHVNARLQVTDPSGKRAIGTLDEALRTIGTTMIPAFYVRQEGAVDALLEYVGDERIEDAFIVSDKGDLIRRARQANPMLRGIIDYTGNHGLSGKPNTKKLMEIVKKTNGYSAKIALLPEDAATADNVAYLQTRLITVWAQQSDKGKPGTTAAALPVHRLIAAGANGIVTREPERAAEVLGIYSARTTLVRKPLNIGHRGIPALAPENTLEGAVLAYEMGADIVENDIYLTKDGHIVIMHDPTIDRTTNGSGNVEDFTLAELKEFKANKQFPEQYPDARIPTLEQFFKRFKGTDLVHFVEIKSYRPEIVDALANLIEREGVEDQVVIISFNADQLRRVREQMPWVSVGYLTGGYANEANVNKSLRETLKAIQGLNATFNTSYGGLGPNFMEAAKHRGMTIWPWTYRSEADFMSYFLYGTYGLTNDYAHWASDWAYGIRPAQTSYKLKVLERTEVSAVAETYKGDSIVVQPEIVLLEGADLVKVEGNSLTGLKPGTAHALLRYTATVGTQSYDLYTQPIAVEVKGGKPR
ncbi:glycerophosphoryl diester phosphodiesterase family protein [Paenibacillus sp. 32O-W]|uniref:glycerophosphodiester phosphodiesterase family protein n=1 Tax=Paenibacillus sp. 32O-W TaxID=1695218 RepID=UPI000721A60A|nr:glycerophosphodiester phosphodiesterase family protein [Paenibacillus sp. 32O-W]ALS30162.1 glycerophosphoryl diester phosphodiesterase family protein [Paenibacillus sp. 32O-W]